MNEPHPNPPFDKGREQTSDARIAAWLALFLFGVYLLSFSGQLYSQDSLSMFSVTESFVKRGEFSTDQLWTLFKARDEIAADGESYAKYGYGMSLFAVPLYALALFLPGELGFVQTTLLTSSIVIALSGALVYLSARRLRFSRGVALITALLFGLATPAWVYAKQFWSEPYALFTLFAAFYFSQRYRDEGHARDAFIAGIALGLAVATRITNAALVPLYALYAFDFRGVLSHALRKVEGGATVQSKGAFFRALAAFTLALGFFALTIAYYDWTRFGNPLATGYRADETFDTPFLLGAYGLLYSPGKGLFVYVPFLAALVYALPAFFHRGRRETLFICLLFTVYGLLFSTWYYWWGGTNWGPRFLVPTLPFLVLLIAPAIERAFPALAGDGSGVRGRGFTALFSALGLIAFCIELLGVSIPALAYRARMLRFSPNPEADSIFLPQFSPLVGYLNMFKPTALDFAWVRLGAGNASVDWLVVAMLVLFVGFCGAMLAAVCRGSLTADPLLRSGRPPTADHAYVIASTFASLSVNSAKQSLGDSQIASLHSSTRSARSGLVLAMTLALAIALSLFSISRYRLDERFGGGDGYRALVETVARQAQARDVLILNDDARAPFFLNENRARLRWYGLSRDPQHWDDATHALLERLSRQYARVWFVFDDAAADAPDPARAWLEQSLGVIERRDFDDGVHLMLFAGK